MLITGAASGIGHACALAFGRRGWRVFAGVADESQAEVVQQAGAGKPLVMDVTSAAAIAAVAATLTEELSDNGLQALVNSAGISVTAPLELLPMAELRRQLEVNVIGQIAVIQQFLPLIRAGHGRIIAIGSPYAWFPQRFAAPYSASKAALESLMNSLRIELEPWRIPVSLVVPGATETLIWQHAGRIAIQITRRMPAGARALYGWPPRPFRKRPRSTRLNPDMVASAVIRAATADRPRATYLVGTEARVIWALTRFVPVRIRNSAAAAVAGRKRP